VNQRTGANLAASIRQRLLNMARETGRPFNEMLQYFAMERFLYRLTKSLHADKFILKGALMLTAWQAPVSRPTMDIDLLGLTNNSIDAIVAVTKTICTQVVEPDGLTFEPESVEGERIVEDADYEMEEFDIPHVDVIIGGLLCQGFSLVGCGKVRSLRKVVRGYVLR